MSLALTTTTITIRRVSSDPARDPYDVQPEPATVASGIPAHIYSPTGEEQEAGGSRSNTYRRLACNLADLTENDTVLDEATSVEYHVEWVNKVLGFGLDHMQARLRLTTGVV